MYISFAHRTFTHQMQGAVSKSKCLRDRSADLGQLLSGWETPLQALKTRRRERKITRRIDNIVGSLIFDILSKQSTLYQVTLF